MEITIEHFELIEHCLSVQRGNVGLSNLQVVNAMLYVAGLTLYPIQYRSELEISGSSEIVVAGSCLQRRANSAGVA